MEPPYVLLAPDKFKGTLTAAQVAAAVSTGVRRARPEARVVQMPVADGGDGTLAAALAAGYAHVPVTAPGPTGEPVATGYARHGDVAVVELADVCGLERLPGRRTAPMDATSRGVGVVVGAAIAAGCTRVVLGLGGSASTDGGAGMLRGLGARLRDEAGDDLPEGGAALTRLAALDLTETVERLAGVELVLANPLLGEHGAAAVYGPQKGATPAQVAALDAALGHFADVVAATTGRDQRAHPGAGAAGGVGFAALAVLGAELRSGIGLVLDLVGFQERLAGADLVITGEGALDEQTLHGKAPAGVAAAAAGAGVPVVAVCGVNELDPGRLAEAGFAQAYALTDLEPDVRRCREAPRELLERLGEQIARERVTIAGKATTLEASA